MRPYEVIGRTSLLALAVGATAVAGCAASRSAQSLVPGTPGSTSTPKVQEPASATATSRDRGLVASAAQFVTMSTGARPAGALVFHTTLAKAARAVDANNVARAADAPVTVVLFIGHFTDHEARVPPGSNAVVSGDEISLVYDAGGRGTDFGVEPKPVDTSAMGEGTRVAVTAVPAARYPEQWKPLR